MSSVSLNRILAVFRIERVHRVDDLGEIVFRLRLSGLVLNCFESGEEQTDQDRDDRDDDQQLNESEGAVRDAVVVGRLFETPNLGQLASAAADALQFWGASSRHYAAKMSLHNVFV